MNILDVWRYWRLYEEVKEMEKKSLINLALSAFAAFVAGFTAVYTVSGDLNSSLAAGGSSALAGVINQIRQSPVSK